ncbi:unnamed protein product [Lathyrus oleraceus]
MNLSFTLRSDEPRTISESRSIPHQIKLQTETAFFLCVRRGRSDLPDLTQTPGDSTWTFLFVFMAILQLGHMVQNNCLWS